MLSALKGVDAVAAVEGLCNPRGFVIVGEYRRSKKYRNIFSAGVCIGIASIEVTPVPTGAPKSAYVIASMVSAIVRNIAANIAGSESTRSRFTKNTYCARSVLIG